MEIQGTAKYIDLETGFWGIISDKGEKYRPLNMPEQLKTDGARVQCKIRKVSEDASIYMWGIAVMIDSFHTIAPEKE